MREPQKTADYSSNRYFNGRQKCFWWITVCVCFLKHWVEILSSSLHLQLSSRREKWGWMTSSRSWCLPHISANSEYFLLKRQKKTDGKLALKCDTGSISGHLSPPGSSIYFWSLAHSWSVSNPRQPPEFGRTFCEKHNLGPRSQSKNSPFMTSLFTTLCTA